MSEKKEITSHLILKRFCTLTTRQKTIYAKIGTNKNEFSTAGISTNFREVECDAGIAITLTIFDKELTD